jgi:nitroreductase
VAGPPPQSATLTESEAIVDQAGHPDTTPIMQLMAARSSVRGFSDELPPRAAVEQVIAAGLTAPYAAAMAPGQRLDRRFFVLPRGSAAVVAAATAIQAHARAALAGGQVPAPLRARLEPVAEGRVQGVGTAPYYVVVAERGAAPVQLQTLGHVLENMWLMATALGLGMHLVSATTTMADDADFCALLGLPAGQYALNGCALGVPAQAPDERPAPDARAVTTWLA